MDHRKNISRRELFYLTVLFQQSGVFWLLPYFLTKENGSAGICAVLAGVLAAGAIILTGQYWSARAAGQGFITALQMRNKAVGIGVGLLFYLFYLLFAIMMLYSIVDVIQKQLLPETPQIVLCVVTALLAGWMSKGGLKDLARMNMLCIAALLLMLVSSVFGTLDLFALEHGLPLQVESVAQLQDAAKHSVFCYSGFLMLFMLYPAVEKPQTQTPVLLCAVGLGAVLTVLWIFYALCILGQHSLQTILWIPVHLARMVQVGALVDQTESLFVVCWMAIALSAGSLLLWCSGESLHQLTGVKNMACLQWLQYAGAFFGMLLLGSTVGLLQAERVMADIMIFTLPAMLLLVILLTPKRRSDP